MTPSSRSGRNSTQNRRGFFKSIAGLFVATAVYKELPAYLPDTGPELLDLPRDIRDQLYRLTQLMHGELVKQVGRTFPDVTAESKISALFPHQCCIDFSLNQKDIDELGDARIIDRFVKPAMTLLANEIEFHKASRFAELPLPMGIDASARVSGNGISLRGLRAYNIHADLEGLPPFITRFDVLFG